MMVLKDIRNIFLTRGRDLVSWGPDLAFRGPELITRGHHLVIQRT